VLTGSKNHNYKKIKNFIAKHNLQKSIKIFLHIPDQHVSYFYNQARAMIMPSFIGPTNIPPIESLRCGCPILVSNVYAAQEQLGSAAIYFNPKSPKSISNSIEKIWSNESVYKNFSRKGISYSKKNNQALFNARLKNILTAI
jgi:glycosyltransferase involved in cell wall biosynthesis